MKKILFSMLLMVSLKSFALDCESSCQSYDSLACFCPQDEINCFTNFVNNTDQLTLYKQATLCQPVMEAINSANYVQDIINDASAIVNHVIHDYFFGGESCNDLVNNYINYAQNNCPASLVGQCQKYSQALSFGQSNCSTTARLVQGAVHFYNNDIKPVVQGIESFGCSICCC